jgi:hypothetical protein
LLTAEVKQRSSRGKPDGHAFGSNENPLLVSVRSGARASMPGMMDTILNLGMNDEAVQGIIKKTNNERFAWDSYRRFVQMYGDVVLGLKPQSKEEEDPFEVIIHKMKHDKGVKNDVYLSADDLKNLVALFKKAVKDNTGHDFPDNPWDQLWELCLPCLIAGTTTAPCIIVSSMAFLTNGEPRKRASHGVWQYGRHQRHRRLLQPRCRHRREHL